MQLQWINGNKSCTDNTEIYRILSVSFIGMMKLLVAKWNGRLFQGVLSHVCSCKLICNAWNILSDVTYVWHADQCKMIADSWWSAYTDICRWTCQLPEWCYHDTHNWEQRDKVVKFKKDNIGYVRWWRLCRLQTRLMLLYFLFLLFSIYLNKYWL